MCVKLQKICQLRSFFHTSVKVLVRSFPCLTIMLGVLFPAVSLKLGLVLFPLVEV